MISHFIVLTSLVTGAAAQCGGQDHVNCHLFMSNGFCTNTARALELRQKVCGRGCGLCPDDCTDSSKLCAAYARTGFCENGKFAVETRRSLCMKTCFCDKRTTTTTAPPPGLPEGGEVKIAEKKVLPSPIESEITPEPVPAVVIEEGGGQPLPVPVVPAPVPVPEPVPVLPVPVPVPVVEEPVTDGVTASTRVPRPVPVVQGPEGRLIVVPDINGSDPITEPVQQPTSTQPARPFTSCGLLRDDTNDEFLVVPDGAAMDLARHEFNDRATSVFLMADCEMDVWEHSGQAGNLLRLHSSSQHWFELYGRFRSAVSSVVCHCR